MPVVDLDQLLERLTQRTTGSAAARIPGLARAVEHIVADIDAASAATPHGTYPVGTTLSPAFLAALDERVAARTGVLLGRLGLIVTGSINGMPTMPIFTALPTAGAQGGQKTEAYSSAFTVSADPTPTMIDASCYLNVSLQLDVVTAPIVDRLLRLAVVAEAESQVIAAIEAVTTTPPADLSDALATFTGPLWSPTLLIVPPGALIGLGVDMPALTAAGIEIALVPTASTVTVLDPLGVNGLLADINLASIEPSVLGRQVASALWGQLSISPGSASSVAVV
jgi:hypothetical protein